MTYEVFVELVMQMRACQKAYFRYQRYEMLEKSKQLEKAVDRAIKGILNQGQGRLL